MTSPDEKLVIYKALADFSEVIREATLARKALQDLHAEQLKGQGGSTASTDAQTLAAAKARHQATVDATKATKDHTHAERDYQREVNNSTRATKSFTETLIDTQKSFDRSTKATQQQRDELGRFTKGVGDAERSTKKLGDQLDKLGRNRGPSLLMAAIVTFAPVAVSALAAVTGAVAGTGGALLAAGGVAAVWATGVIAQIASVKKAYEAFSQTGGPVPAGMEATFNAIKGLREEWAQFQQDTQGPVLETFVTAIDMVGPLLEKITPIVNKFAISINDALEDIDRADITDGFFGWLERVGPGVIESFTRIVIRLGGAIDNMFERASGQGVETFMSGLERAIDRFATWMENLQESAELREFFAFVKTEGPQVWDTVMAIASAVLNLLEALAPLGSITLFIVRAFAELIAAIPTPLLTAFLAIVISLTLALKALMIVNAVRTGFIALRVALTQASIGMRIFVASLGVVGLALSVVATLMSVFSGSSEDMYEGIQANQGAVSDLNKVLKEQNGIYTETVKQQAIKALADQEITGQSEKLLDIQRQYNLSLDDMAKAATGDTKALSRLTAEIERQQVALAGEGGFMDEETRNKVISLEKAKRALTELSNATSNAQRLDAYFEAQVAATRQEMDRFEREAYDVAKAIENFWGPLAAVSPAEQGMETARTALEAYYETVQRSVEAQVKEREVLEQNAEREKSARQALSDAAQDGAEQVEAAEKSLREAQKSSLRAQEDLTRAREEATRALEDMKRTLRDLPDSEEQARISLLRAQLDFEEATVGPGGFTAERQQQRAQLEEQLRRREAALSLKDAEENLSDTLQDNVRTREEIAEAERLGVENAPNVVAAKERLVEALDQEREAEESLGKVRVDSARRYTEAQANLNGVLKENRNRAQDAASSTKQLRGEVDEAKSAADRAAIAVGETTAGIAAYSREVDSVPTLIMQLEGQGFVLSELEKVAIQIEAIKLLAANPSMTAAEAVKRATQQMRGQLPKPGKYISPIDKGTSPSQDKQNQGALGGHFATGGFIDGPGSKTSDEIPIWASRGEFMQPADAVDYYGQDFMELIRKKRFPKLGFFKGGPVPAVLPVQGTNPAASLLKGGILGRAEAAAQAYYGGVGIGTQSGERRSKEFGGVMAHVAYAAREVERAVGKIPSIGGVANRNIAGTNTLSDHATGHALDFMVYKNRALGEKVKNYLQTNAQRLLVKYLIWWGKYSGSPPRAEWENYTGRNPHRDHVHASFTSAKGRTWGPPGQPQGDPEWIGGPSGGAGVERWRGVVLQALRIVGQANTHANRTLRRMNQESSGNPRAVNLWDSNAKRGYPSTGLMQVIRPTYQSNRHPLYDRGPYMYGVSIDPLANILSSMRYALRRYGSLSAAYDRKGGYASGGPIQLGDFGSGLGSHGRGYRMGGYVPDYSPRGSIASMTGATSRTGFKVDGDVVIHNPIQEKSTKSLRRNLDVMMAVGGGWDD